MQAQGGQEIAAWEAKQARRISREQALLHPRAVDTVIDPHATIVGMYTHYGLGESRSSLMAAIGHAVHSYGPKAFLELVPLKIATSVGATSPNMAAIHI